MPSTVSAEGDGSGTSVITITTSEKSSKISKKSHGGGKGRKAALKQKLKEEERSGKRERDANCDLKFSGLVDAVTDIKEVMQKKNNVNSLGGATELASDPETKSRLEKN